MFAQEAGRFDLSDAGYGFRPALGSAAGRSVYRQGRSTVMADEGAGEAGVILIPTAKSDGRNTEIGREQKPRCRAG